MRYIVVFSFISMILLLTYVGCKDQPVIPDTPVIKFADNIQPIIVGNCTASGCHGNTNPQQFLLYTYDDVMKHGKVKSKDAKGSKLYQVITSNIDGQKMPPKPNPDLTETQIEMIYLWIMQGAKNN